MPQSPLAPKLEALVTQYRKVFQHELAALGIGPGQWRVLEFVLSTPRVNQGVVAQRLHVDKSVVCRAASSLERTGLLDRRKRRGRQMLSATRLAVALEQFVRESQMRVDREMLGGFTSEEAESFGEYIAGATRNLHCHRSEPPAAEWMRRFGDRGAWLDLPLE